MRRVLLTAALAAATLGATSASAKEAVFAVRISAAQDVGWYRDMTVHGCSDSVAELTGRGEAHLRVHSTGAPWVAVQRIDSRRAVMVAPTIHAAGSLARDGAVATTASTPPRDVGACPQAIPVAGDCGTRALPIDATLSLSYALPGGLGLLGPHSTRWLEARPFDNCPGVNGDDVAQAGPAALPLARIFGTRKRFTVHWTETRTVETVQHGGLVLSGTFPVTTTTRWSVRFTRLNKRPAPALGTPEGL